MTTEPSSLTLPLNTADIDVIQVDIDVQLCDIGGIRDHPEGLGGRVVLGDSAGGAGKSEEGEEEGAHGGGGGVLERASLPKR